MVSNPPWGMRIGNRDDDRYERNDDRYNRDDDRYDDRDDRGAEYGDGNWDADPDAAKEAPASPCSARSTLLISCRPRSSACDLVFTGFIVSKRCLNAHQRWVTCLLPVGPGVG